MTTRSSRRVACRLAATGSIAVALVAGASVASDFDTDFADPSAVCRSIGDVARSQAASDAEFNDAVRADPDRGIAVACAARATAHDTAERVRADARLGIALLYASREGDALQVLDRAIVASASADVDPGGRAALRVARGLAYRLTRQWKSAEADLDLARELQVASGRTRTRLYAQTLIGLASVRETAMRLDAADAAVAEADAIVGELGLRRSRDAVDVLNERTMIAYARQDLQGTLRLAQAAADLLASIAGPDDAELLEPLATLIAVRTVVGDFDGSEAVGRDALRIVAAHPDRAFDARLGIVQNLAVNYQARAQAADALPLAVDALAMSERHYGADAPAVLRAHLTLGALYMDLTRYADASDEFDKADAIATRVPGGIPLLQRLRLLFGRASLHLKMGDLDRSRDALAAADDAMRGQAELAYWRAWRFRLACKLDALHEDWSAADADCAQSLAYDAKVVAAGHWLVADMIASRCLAQTLGRLQGDGCDRVADRLATGPTLPPRIRVLAYESLAIRDSARGDADAAYALRLEALAAAEDMTEPDPAWTAEHALAQSLAEQGQRPLAILFGKRSIGSIERMRESLGADRARFERGFLSNKLVVYRHVADWLLAEGRPAEAIDVLRLLKVEEMNDFAERPATRAVATAVTLTPRETALAIAFRAAPRSAPSSTSASSSASTSASGDGEADEVARLVRLRDDHKLTGAEGAYLDSLLEAAARRQRVRATELRRLVDEHRVAAASAPASDVPAEDVAAARDVRAVDQADAYLYVTEGRLRMIFVWAGGIVQRSIDVDPRQLNRDIADHLASLSSPASVDAPGRASPLYRSLGEPLDREARVRGIGRIRLWLDGALRYVPFAALWDGRSYLVERYEFSYRLANAPGAAGSSSTPPKSRTLLAFGVTRSFDGLAALPGVRDELCGIVDGPVSGLDDDGRCTPVGLGNGIFRGAGYVNAFFTEARLRSLLVVRSPESRAAARPAPVGVLHLGTHLSLRPGNVDRSWLLLGDGTHLNLTTLQSMDLAGIDLVTLSACQSGMAGGIGDDGREIEGLPTVLHRSGARAVLASLWRIDDRATARLMRTFYRALNEPSATAGDALRRAQLTMIRDGGAYRHPYYWAAFVPSTTAD